MNSVPYRVRVEFVLELAARLHRYGTTAQRLEGAIGAVSTRLGLRCDPWSSPTGLILSFSDAERPDALANTTQVIRLAPGDVDLHKLCEVDAIAEGVLRGEIDVAEATAAMHALDQPLRWREELMSVLGFGVTSAAIASLLRAGWVDVAVAGGIGVLIGALAAVAAHRPRLGESLELLAALLATLLTMAWACFVTPLSIKTVVVASVIVLMPGMMLTNAVSELTSQHLSSGTARFAGALAVLLKLAFGSLVASQLALLLHWTPLEHQALTVLPRWAEWVALPAAAWSFAVLFKAAWRDYPLVMAAAMSGYLVTRVAGLWLPGVSAVFVASLVVTVLSNGYARLANRPGALIRVPGIILMVPGSIGFRGVSSMLEQNVSMGLDTVVNLVTVLVALVGGILIGNVLLPARRNL